jgi:hypothetical protein
MGRIPVWRASEQIKKGALGIGEIHTMPEGRRLAIDLIRAGLVRNLFLEVPRDYQGAFDGIGAHPDDPNVEKKLQTAFLMRNRGHDVAGLDVHIATVAAAAYRKGGIKVYCADTLFGIPHKEPAMKSRDANVVELVRQETGAMGPTDNAAIGTLILFGSEHFERNFKTSIANVFIKEIIKSLSYVLFSYN